MSKEIYDGGAVIVEDGVVYVDILLILKRLGIPDTPAARDMAVKTIKDAFRGAMPEMPVYVVSLQ